jgi:hypothetical protein
MRPLPLIAPSLSGKAYSGNTLAAPGVGFGGFFVPDRPHVAQGIGAGVAQAHQEKKLWKDWPGERGPVSVPRRGEKRCQDPFWPVSFHFQEELGQKGS